LCTDWWTNISKDFRRNGLLRASSDLPAQVNRFQTIVNRRRQKITSTFPQLIWQKRVAMGRETDQCHFLQVTIQLKTIPVFGHAGLGEKRPVRFHGFSI